MDKSSPMVRLTVLDVRGPRFVEDNLLDLSGPLHPKGATAALLAVSL